MSKMELMLKRKFLSVIEYFRMIIILSIIRLREDELEDSREGGEELFFQPRIRLIIGLYN